MRVKKIVILVLLLITLSGCEATYKLNISVDNVDEEIKISASGISKEQMNIYLNRELVNNPELSNYDITTKGNTVTLKKQYKTHYYSASSPFFYNGVSGLLGTYDYSNDMGLYTNDDITVFNKYPELDALNIEVKVENVVLEHNADEVKGDNIYIWCFTPSNYVGKRIELKLSHERYIAEEKKEAFGKQLQKILVGVVLAFIIVGVVIWLNILLKKRINNTI